MHGAERNVRQVASDFYPMLFLKQSSILGAKQASGRE